MKILLLLSLAVTLAQEKKSDRIVKSLNDDATFQCSSSASDDQMIKVIFTSVVTKQAENVLIMMKNGGTVTTMFQKDVRIHGNAGTVTVEGVQLEDEGDYECNILHTNNGREETSTHELVVRIKPTVEEILDLASENKPIVDYNDNKLTNGPVPVDVAKCIVKNAKPKAQVRWEFESEQLKIEDGVPEDFPDKNKQKYDTTSTLRIIPQAYYDNQVVRCIVSHVELGKDIVKTFKLNVHYAPKTPVIRPNLATNKLTCESQANPEPNYGWIMPDNSNLLDQNTIDMMPDYMGNPNATYRCTVTNDYGSAFKIISNQEIQTYTEDETTIASMPLIIGVSVLAIIFFCVIGFLIWKCFLSQRQSNKDYSSYPYAGTTSKSDQIVTGDQYTHPVPNYDQGPDSADEDHAPILSPNAASYHAARRQGDQLRHSPSRGGGGGAPPAGAPQNYYPSGDEHQGYYDEDELIDNVQGRWADYHPGHPSEQPKQGYVAMRQDQNFHSEMV